MRNARPFVAVFAIGLASCDPSGPDLDGPTWLTPLTALDLVVETGESLSLSVHVINGHGNSLGGITVLWETVTGSASIQPPSVRTSADGIASAVLIGSPGETRVFARIPNTNLKIAFAVHGCSDCGEWSRVPVELNADGRAWASAASVDGKIWVLGGETPGHGSDAIDMFDPAGVTWQRAARLPAPLSASITATLDDKIYLIGGYVPESYPWSGSQIVTAFDPSTRTSTSRADLTVGRYRGAGAALGGRIYVVGGYAQCDCWEDFCSGPLANVEIYDPIIDRWTNGPSLNVPRAEVGAAVLDGKLYVAGGITGNSLGSFFGVAGTVEVFDPQTAQWSEKAHLPAYGPARLVVMNGTLYAFVWLDDRKVTLTLEYDPARDEWARLRDAPIALLGAAVVAVEGSLYAIGRDAVYVFRRRVQ